jgi:predicted HTH transcriptional regulator
MIIKDLKELITNGENITVEFKECRENVNKDVYKSIGAFLNRNGGHIILGVNDNGKVTGINKSALPKIKKDLVTSLNNPEKINPPLYIIPNDKKRNSTIYGTTDGASDGTIVGTTESNKTKNLFSKIIDTTNSNVSKNTKIKLSVLLFAIFQDEGERIPFYLNSTKIGSRRTIERLIKHLKATGLIEFKGNSLQTGGYFITQKLNELLKDENNNK